MSYIRARTYEKSGGKWTLVLEHIFYGPTIERAREIFDAHMETDAFLSGCTCEGNFEGIVCRTDVEEVP